MPEWTGEASRRQRPLHLELEYPREEEPRRRPTNTTIRYTSGNQQALRESVQSGRLRRWRCLRGASRSVELTGPKFSWDIMASTIVALVWISRTNGETCASRNRRQVLSKFALGMAKLGLDTGHGYLICFSVDPRHVDKECHRVCEAWHSGTDPMACLIKLLSFFYIL